MAVDIASTAIVYPEVTFLGSAYVEDGCIIGSPLNDYEDQPETIIGDGAVLRTHTVIYAGNTIGKNFSTGNKANIREFNTIGNNVSVGTMAVVEHHVSMGDNVRLHSQSFVPEFSVLEDDVWIGPNAVITNTRYPLSPQAKASPQPVKLEKAAIVGANATILPGVIIGYNSLIGAGSVVVKDVPPHAVVVGNPAHVIRSKKELPYEQI